MTVDAWNRGLSFFASLLFNCHIFLVRANLLSHFNATAQRYFQAASIKFLVADSNWPKFNLTTHVLYFLHLLALAKSSPQPWSSWLQPFACSSLACAVSRAFAERLIKLQRDCRLSRWRCFRNCQGTCAERSRPVCAVSAFSPCCKRPKRGGQVLWSSDCLMSTEFGESLTAVSWAP